MDNIKTKLEKFESLLQDLKNQYKVIENLRKQQETEIRLLDTLKQRTQNALRDLKTSCDDEWQRIPRESKGRGVLHPWSYTKGDLLQTLNNL